jgi:nitric oxide dioxygenase
VNPQRRVIFAHAARDAAHHPLRPTSKRCRPSCRTCHVVTFYEDGQRRRDRRPHGRGALPAWPREETDVWLCGPHKFMQAQWLALLHAGVPAARLHREVFGPELLDHLL